MWHARNKFLFEGKKLDPVVSMAKAIMDVYQIMQFQNQEGQRSTEDLAMQRWNPPPSNKLKVNVDVAIHEDRQVARLEAVIRNSQG